MMAWRTPAFLVVVAACGGCLPLDPFASSPGDPLDHYAGYLARVFDGYCRYEVRCGGIGSSEREACVAGYQTLGGLYDGPGSANEALDAGRLVYDKDAARRCLDVPDDSCDYLPRWQPDNPCARVLVGRVPLGGRCLSSTECSEGWCMTAGGKQPTIGCAGACTAFVSTGESCDDAARRCAANNRCDATSQLCVAQLGLGVACNADSRVNECQYGLTCDANNRCVPYPEYNLRTLDRGVTCNGQRDCREGLLCLNLDVETVNGKQVVTPGTCAAWLDVGSACNPDVLNTGCPGDMACDPVKKSCQPRLRVGQPCIDMRCNTASGPDLTWCDPQTLTCKAFGALGQPCSPDTWSCFVGACDRASRTCRSMCL